MIDARLSEKCGVFGVYGKDFEAARLVHPGLWALQHRGQESSGIASSDGKTVRVKKGIGLVSHVFSEEDLKYLKGYLAIG
ncbi:amidophosphoribosyltransferase, partial [Candidatus Microgenomates bacterium]|nr:amidophosphoribosyltransferase [Candidatus Microgenomates bacterium]